MFQMRNFQTIFSNKAVSSRPVLGRVVCVGLLCALGFTSWAIVAVQVTVLHGTSAFAAFASATLLGSAVGTLSFSRIVKLSSKIPSLGIGLSGFGITFLPGVFLSAFCTFSLVVFI